VDSQSLRERRWGVEVKQRQQIAQIDRSTGMTWTSSLWSIQPTKRQIYLISEILIDGGGVKYRVRNQQCQVLIFFSSKIQTGRHQLVLQIVNLDTIQACFLEKGWKGVSVRKGRGWRARSAQDKLYKPRRPECARCSLERKANPPSPESMLGRSRAFNSNALQSIYFELNWQSMCTGKV